MPSVAVSHVIRARSSSALTTSLRGFFKLSLLIADGNQRLRIALEHDWPTAFQGFQVLGALISVIVPFVGGALPLSRWVGPVVERPAGEDIEASCRSLHFRLGGLVAGGQDRAIAGGNAEPFIVGRWLAILGGNLLIGRVVGA